MKDIGTIPCISNDEQIFTGVSNCNKAEKKVVALLISGIKAEYPSDAAAFNAGLQGWVNADSDDLLKLFVLKGAILTGSNGGDITTSDQGYGVSIPVGYNALSQTIRLRGAGDCLAKQLAKFNGKQARIFRIDDEDAAYGTASKKTDGTIVFKGYNAILMMSEALNDGSNDYILTLNIYYEANYDKERKNRHAVILDAVPDPLSGVILKKGAAAGTASVVDICSTDDYTDIYGDDWDETMFVASDGTNPTTVTYNAATKLLTFAPTTSPYKVAGAAALSAGNIIGLEGANEYVPLT
jgi:hypothetical protein